MHEWSAGTPDNERLAPTYPRTVTSDSHPLFCPLYFDLFFFKPPDSIPLTYMHYFIFHFFFFLHLYVTFFLPLSYSFRSSARLRCGVWYKFRRVGRTSRGGTAAASAHMSDQISVTISIRTRRRRRKKKKKKKPPSNGAPTCLLILSA